MDISFQTFFSFLVIFGSSGAHLNNFKMEMCIYVTCKKNGCNKLLLLVLLVNQKIFIRAHKNSNRYYAFPSPSPTKKKSFHMKLNFNIESVL